MILIKETLLQLLFALMPFVMFNVYYRDKTRNYSRKFMIITCASSLFLSMTFASSVNHGVFFDCRYIIMFFGIVFGGLQTGVILLVEFVLYRCYLGGEGVWIALFIMMCTFPLSVLFHKLYQRTPRILLVTFIAGVVFSVIPFLFGYYYFGSSFSDALAYHIVALLVQNSVGIWLLISLFNKSISDKELYISYAENEKVNTISHVAASLAHEVRNPLTTVKGFLKLIRESPRSDKVEQYIAISMDEIGHTECILSEYLSLSKPLAARLEHTDLVHQLQIIVDAMTPYATMNQVHLSVHSPAAPIWILANADKIKQVLINFVKNAVQACSEACSGKVSLRLKVESGNVILVIKDNGAGMNKAQIDRLGSIYFSSKTSGSGLGLTFSYQLIRAIGGAIAVRSVPRAGTMFTITFPLVKEKSID